MMEQILEEELELIPTSKKKVIAFIPARKGSKRLPNKNRKMFCGKELIRWSIDEALKCEFIDEIIVSTDDEYILNMCKGMYKYSPRVKVVERPKELAEDDSLIIDVILDATKLEAYNSTILLLQPTSPLRDKEDIIYAYKHLFYMGRYTLSIVSACYEYPSLEIKLNGAIYIGRLDSLRLERTFYHNPIIYMMPKERSVDIDDIDDFNRAERLMEARLKNGLQ